MTTDRHRTREPAIQVSGLCRTYGKGDEAFEAVRGVDFAVPAGTVTALLGTNGAGKTSTLELIEGWRLPATARCACWASTHGVTAWRCAAGPDCCCRAAASPET